MPDRSSRAVRQLTLRGVPLWLLREYLADLGAQDAPIPNPGPTDPDGIAAPDGAMRSPDGWQVLYRTEETPAHPRLPTKIANHHLTFTHQDEPSLQALLERFMRKAHRGGG